jgi:hypothetical protein
MDIRWARFPGEYPRPGHRPLDHSAHRSRAVGSARAGEALGTGSDELGSPQTLLVKQVIDRRISFLVHRRRDSCRTHSTMSTKPAIGLCPDVSISATTPSSESVSAPTRKSRMRSEGASVRGSRRFWSAPRGGGTSSGADTASQHRDRFVRYSGLRARNCNGDEAGRPTGAGGTDACCLGDSRSAPRRKIRRSRRSLRRARLRLAVITAEGRASVMPPARATSR